MKSRRLVFALPTGLVAALAAQAAVWAQDGAAPVARVPRSTIGDPYGFLSTLLFGVLGVLIAIIGFKLFDIVIKHDIENEIFEGKNMAAALLAGAVILGVSLIVAATILS
jgi:uncharacterized membrane protein YjfL (UPF0719 family)